MKKPQMGRWKRRQRHVMKVSAIHKAVADKIANFITSTRNDCFFKRLDMLYPLHIPNPPLDPRGNPIVDYRQVVIQWDSVLEYLGAVYGAKLVPLNDYFFSKEHLADKARGVLTEGEIARKCIPGGAGKETVGYASYRHDSDNMIVIANLWRKEQIAMGIGIQLQERVEVIRHFPSLEQRVFNGQSKGQPPLPVTLKLAYKP